MREHALNLEVGHAAAVNYAGNTRFKMPPCAQNAEARHAGVHLDVNAQLCAELGCGCIVFMRLGKAGDCLRDVVGYQVRHLLGGRVAEDEDGHYDAVCAQLHRLIEARNGQIIRAELLKRARDVNRTVTVSVGLDDAEKFDVFSDARAQSLIVMLYRVERDLCPCSAESGSHAVTFIPEC